MEDGGEGGKTEGSEPKKMLNTFSIIYRPRFLIRRIIFDDEGREGPVYSGGVNETYHMSMKFGELDLVEGFDVFRLRLLGGTKSRGWSFESEEGACDCALEASCRGAKTPPFRGSVKESGPPPGPRFVKFVRNVMEGAVSIEGETKNGRKEKE